MRTRPSCSSTRPACVNSHGLRTWHGELGLAAVHVQEGHARTPARQQRVDEQPRERGLAGALHGHAASQSARMRRGARAGLPGGTRAAPGRTLLPQTAVAAAGRPAAASAALAAAMPSAACAVRAAVCAAQCAHLGSPRSQLG